MAPKRSSATPNATVQAVQARAVRACTNPDTGELFDKALILQVFRTMCHDGDPNERWTWHSDW